MVARTQQCCKAVCVCPQGDQDTSQMLAERGLAPRGTKIHHRCWGSEGWRTVGHQGRCLSLHGQGASQLDLDGRTGLERKAFQKKGAVCIKAQRTDITNA